MEVKQLQERYRSLIAEAKRLGDAFKGREAEMSADTIKQIDGILGQADEVKAKIDLVGRMGDAERYLNEPVGTPATHHGYRQAGPDEGNPAVDVKSWRSLKVATPFGEREYRYFVPEAVQGKGYAPAFEGYLRKGYSEMGPNDRKALSEGVDSAGGFLVPADEQARLIQRVATMAAIRGMASVMQTGRDVVNFPKINYSSDDKYTSGVRFTWTGEVPSSSEVHRVTDPVFGKLSIPVHTAMASMPLYRDLIEDSAFDVLGIASDKIGEAFALGEDDVFINGTGINRPMGILADVDGDGPASVASGTSGAIATSGDAHSGKRINSLYYAVPAQYRTRAQWLMNSQTLLAIEDLVDAQKRPIIQTLVGGSIQSGEPGVIKGKPIRVDEFVPDIAADAYPIVFGDFSGYQIVDRVGLAIQRLDEKYAEQNMVVLLARRRVGGYLAEPWRLRVMKAAV